MELRRLGASGLVVPALGLGTLTWGREQDAHEARELLAAYVEAGGYLLDTAASYGSGASEETLGAVWPKVAKRSDLLLCSKAGADGGGRGNLLATLDQTLGRLGTDYLDLWFVQAFDAETPLEETLGALDFAVRSGRARYAGISNYPAWATARAATLAGAPYGGVGVLTGSTPLTAVQIEYSLLQRSAEREVLPAADALGLGTIAWSPLGRGVLTGKYRRARPADSRASSPHLRSFVEPYLTDSAARVVEAVATAALGLGLSAAQVSLAWTAARVDCVLAGPRTLGQLMELLAEADRVLPEPITQVLDEVTEPAP